MKYIKFKNFIISLLAWHGWSAPVFSIVLAVTITAPIWKNIKGQYNYQEFVVGLTSWGNKGKGADFLAFYILIGLTLSIYALLQYAISRDENFSGRLAEIVRSLVLISFLPLAFWFGSLLVDPHRAGLPIEWAIAGISLLILLTLFVWKNDAGRDPEILFRICILFLITILLLLFVGYAPILIISLLKGDLWMRNSVDLCLGVVLSLGLVTLFGFLLKLGFSSALERFLIHFLLFLQIPLPLLFFAVLPPRLIYQSKLEDYQFPVLLVVCVLGCIWVAWRQLYFRGRSLWTGSSHPVREVLSPLCLMGVAIFIGTRSSGVPTFFADNFHLGEQLLPWQQLVQFAKIPYIDFAPVHGLMPLIVGFLNWFFYDGTMANLINATNLLQAIGCGLTFLSVYYLVGVYPALFCAFLFSSQFFGSSFDRLLFLAPAVFFLANPKLFAIKKKWVIAWLAVSTFMALYNPSAGGAFCVGTFPFMLWQLGCLFREDWQALLKIGLCSLVILGIILALPLSREILLGYLTFIAENGATNTVAHGIPYSMSLGKTPFERGLLSNFVVFEIFRFLWIPILFVGVFLTLRVLAEKRESDIESKIFLLLCPVFIFTILSVWSLGRIDPSAASRTGGVSFVMFGLFLPVFIVTLLNKKSLLAFVILALIGGSFGSLFNFQDHFSVRQLGHRAICSVAVPTGLQKISGSDIGMPNLGLIYADEAQLQKEVSFRDSLATVISDDQSYFDLTNNQAHYFFGKKAVPALYSATFNVVNRRQQSRILHQLRASPPTAVVIAPSMNFDGFSSSLRSFYLYREFILNYNPVQVGHFIFLVNHSSPAFSTAAVGAEKKKILSDVFAHFDLKYIPVNWGRSWAKLQNVITKVSDLTEASITGLNRLNSCVTGEFEVLEPVFDEDFYLQTYPDVAAAVTSGYLESGLQHYLLYGKGEGRLPSKNLFPPSVDYDLLSLNLSGQDVDFVVIDISGDSPRNALNEIFLKWSADGEWTKTAVRVAVKDQRLVVPVSSFPRWLLAKRLETIQLSLPGTVHGFKLDKLSLWRRKDI